MRKKKHNKTIQYVIILDEKGKRLRSTRDCANVRHLLKDGHAIVINKKPFTIQLTPSFFENR